ncbi:MAG TPA: LON peptidase substrate-binding domain-containing protein, partial [Longimicrobium sp.]
MASTQRGTPGPERIPVLPIRSTVVFPGGATALQIGYGPNVEALTAHPAPELEVATVSTDEDSFPLDPRSLEKVATATRVLDRLNLPGGTIQTTLQGLRRIRLADVRLEDGYYTAVAFPVDDSGGGPTEETERLVERILTAVSGVAALGERLSDEVPRVLRMNLSDCGRFADLAATLCNFRVPDRDAVLQAVDVTERLRVVLAALEAELEELAPVVEVGEDAPPTAELPAGARERGVEIRKRIHALQAELGEIDPMEREATEFLRRVERSALPQRIAVVARREAERLRSVGVTSTEASEIRGYLDALISVPWERGRGARIELSRVEAAIEDEHLGLHEARERLLEVIAVAQLRGDLRGPIPCLVGPPGVGKRTLAEAIARGLGRPFIRLELGGRGEAQLVGSRRARPGAQLGKIVAAIREAGRPDVVFFMEEMDEIGLGNVEGDPVEALEEALDPEHRGEFIDRYLDLPFDLSQVLFIAGAADFYRIPRDLRDLFIEIRIAGYTPEEKIAIAREWLLPRIVREHGLAENSVEVDDDTL